MLDREVGNGEQLACLFLDLTRQPIRRDGNGDAGLVAGDPAPPQPLGYRCRRPASNEKVRDSAVLR